MKVEISFDCGEDAAGVLAGLADFNERELGPADRRFLNVFLKSDGDLKGGILGYSAWGSAHIEKLWVSDAIRGQGLGSPLLREAEDEAIRRSCTFVWLDTLNPAAAALYERLGYELFGEIPQFTRGKARRFYMKSLVPGHR